MRTVNAVKPWRRLLREEMALPSGVRGPVGRPGCGSSSRVIFSCSLLVDMTSFLETGEGVAFLIPVEQGGWAEISGGGGK